MADTITAIIKPAFLTPNEFGYELMAVAHRPELLGHRVTACDAGGRLLDSIVVVATSASDGAREYQARLVTADDHIASLTEGDTV